MNAGVLNAVKNTKVGSFIFKLGLLILTYSKYFLMLYTT